MSSTSKGPNCLECAYLKVTWDTKFPRSCTYFGFKTKTLPSMEVLANTGKQCFVFLPIAGQQQQSNCSGSHTRTTKPDYSTISILG
jgi:hypothetical protein